MEGISKPIISPEVYDKEYERAKTRLFDIFKNKDEGEINELYSEIGRFAGVIEWNPESVIEEIKMAFNQEDPNIFVETSFNALKELLDKKIENPQAFEKVRREGIMQHHGNIKLSELMYYNVDLEHNAAFIHVAPKGDLKLGEILKSFRDGMKELARQIKDNERIKEIQATSWIVASNPKLLERAGFTVEGLIDEKTRVEHFEEEERPVAWAHISKENLLKVFGDKK